MEKVEERKQEERRLDEWLPSAPPARPSGTTRRDGHGGCRRARAPLRHVAARLVRRDGRHRGLLGHHSLHAVADGGWLDARDGRS